MFKTQSKLYFLDKNTTLFCKAVWVSKKKGYFPLEPNPKL